jgi:hypothetical protein
LELQLTSLIGYKGVTNAFDWCKNAVATFVPAQADLPRVLLMKIAFGVCKILIDKHR